MAKQIMLYGWEWKWAASILFVVEIIIGGRIGKDRRKKLRNGEWTRNYDTTRYVGKNWEVASICVHSEYRSNYRRHLHFTTRYGAVTHCELQWFLIYRQVAVWIFSDIATVQNSAAIKVITSQMIGHCFACGIVLEFHENYFWAWCKCLN